MCGWLDICVCVCVYNSNCSRRRLRRESRKICENLLLRASGKRDFHVHVLGKLFALASLAHSQSMCRSVCMCCVCVCAWLTIIQKFYKQNERPLHGRRAETETTCKQFSSAIFGFSTASFLPHSCRWQFAGVFLLGVWPQCQALNPTATPTARQHQRDNGTLTTSSAWQQSRRKSLGQTHLAFTEHSAASIVQVNENSPVHLPLSLSRFLSYIVAKPHAYNGHCESISAHVPSAYHKPRLAMAQERLARGSRSWAVGGDGGGRRRLAIEYAEMWEIAVYSLRFTHSAQSSLPMCATPIRWSVALVTFAGC